MRTLFAADALLSAGWRRDVRIDVGDDGMIAQVHENAQPDAAQVLRGPLLPGMPNAHSHAFQRAMAGLTARGGAGGDDFWSWRELMYRFLGRITPDDMEAIAAQLYVEMLEAGYTSVAEFHYLHHDPQGAPYADHAEMAQRVLAAGQRAGIAMTLLPVFYAHANFGGVPAALGQRRFLHDVASFNRLLTELHRASARFAHVRVGVAPHSLRAVLPDELSAVVAHACGLDADMPIHIHLAEQQKEVDDCVAWSGLRPAQWLLAHAEPDPHWCVVHATHLNERETHLLATAGAVACVCPTTEADLGDGIFPAQPWLDAAGVIALGGDSHVGVDPFAELRLLEYSQRLARERRNVLARAEQSVGERLWNAACMGGAQALGQPVGTLAVGQRADLVVLDADDVALAELRAADALDAAIFGPARAPVRDVMVAGAWRVREGQHVERDAVRLRYRATLRHLLER